MSRPWQASRFHFRCLSRRDKKSFRNSTLKILARNVPFIRQTSEIIFSQKCLHISKRVGIMLAPPIWSERKIWSDWFRDRGRMAEWLIVPPWKGGMSNRASRVRIPLLPPRRGPILSHAVSDFLFFQENQRFFVSINCIRLQQVVNLCVGFLVGSYYAKGR